MPKMRAAFVVLPAALTLLAGSACLQAPERKGFADTGATADVEAPADTPSVDLPGQDTSTPVDTANPDVPVTEDTVSPKDVPDVPGPDPFSRLCRPCLTDAECVPEGAQPNGQACVARGGFGSFCGTKCAADSDCPEEYECPPNVGQCVLVAGAECPCPPGFEDYEMACRQENEHGTCHGTVVCGGICDAAYPMAEMCNGIDDDCDDATDEGNPCDDGLACTDDVCPASFECKHTYRDDFCLHSGQCYADGDALASNACMVCDASQLPAAWKALPHGATCGPGMACFMGTCQTSRCPEGYVEVPAGSFTMGSPASEPMRDGDETQHSVKITNAFCLKATEVTQDEWKFQVGSTPSSFFQCGGDCPLENVSWWDALAFCNHMSNMEGLEPCYTLKDCSGTFGVSSYSCQDMTFAGLGCTGYRLPTEAEWEYAARAGTAEATYNGTVSSAAATDCSQEVPGLVAIAWYCGNSNSAPHPVAGLAPNAWGLWDMLGNVQEWVFDADGVYGTDDVPLVDPFLAVGTQRVVRGGAWNLGAGAVRAANRERAQPLERAGNLGFRMVRAPSP